MKVSVLAVIVTAIAAMLVLPALGQGGNDGRKVLDAKVLAPVIEPYTGTANPIRGLGGGSLPWQINSGKADVRSDGRVKVEVEGLVLAQRAPVPANLQGTNPVPQFKAVVSCQSSSGGVATVANVSTATASASPSGDAEIEDHVALPSPCFAPIVFVTTPGNAWLAVTGR